MTDDPVLKMYEAQAELVEKNQELNKTRKELEKVRRDYKELKNQMVVNNFTKAVSEIQSKVDAISNRLEDIQKNFNSLPIRVSNNEKALSEIKEVLWKFNEITQAIKMDETNLKKEEILLIGGYSKGNRRDTLLILHNNEENWRELTVKLPYPVSYHGAQFLNNHLYIFGGVNAHKEKLSSTYKLSRTLKWEKMADMNNKRSEISNSNVILNDKIWVLGGWDGQTYFKSIEMYNPVTNKWKYMGDMNEYRVNAAAAVVNGKIFCCGGHNQKKYFNSAECYDSFSNIWTLIPDMPEPRARLGAIEMAGNLIVIGGRNTKNNYLKNVWVLDTSDKNTKWIEYANMSLSRCDFCIAKIDGKIFVCGGSSDGKLVDTVEFFDEEVWKNGPKLTTKLEGVVVISIPMDFIKCLK